jgi:hypothetical protein
MLVALASVSFSYAPHIDAGAPTPWLGLTERIAQWTYYIWQIVLVVLLAALRPERRARHRA